MFIIIIISSSSSSIVVVAVVVVVVVGGGVVVVVVVFLVFSHPLWKVWLICSHNCRTHNLFLCIFNFNFVMYIPFVRR